MGWEAAETLIHGEQLYTHLLAHIRADQGLIDAMWADAESRIDELDQPDTHWTVTLLDDGTPAAWCAASIRDDGTIKAHSNYEVPAHRGRGLYELAHHRRHRDVLLAYKRPAISYLFPQPVALHEMTGWRTTGTGGNGEIAGHRWVQMTWQPFERRSR